MPFLLSRGGNNNVAAEVQRWQYFLRKQDIPQVGVIDGGFGMNTETATRLFQTRHGIPTTGKLDTRTLDVAQTLNYTVQPNNYYSERASTSYPPRPSDLSGPDNETRNTNFKCFKFIQQAMPPRTDLEAIIIKGSCDSSDGDWETAQIVTIDIPQLKFARGYTGRFRTHRKAAPLFAALFAKWEADDLLHLIMTYEGCYVPRYKRGLKQKPPLSGHGLKRSTDPEGDKLSNHSFGTAFDINQSDNSFRKQPAICGQRGATRELVAAANSLGIYWGGHFSVKDGMHFEISKLD